MKNLFIAIGAVYFILIVHLGIMSATEAAVDSDFTQTDLDAYKENYVDPDLLKKKGEVYYKKLLSPDFVERDHAVFFFSHFRKEELNEKILKTAAELLRKEAEREKTVENLFRKGNLADLPKELAYINSEEYGMYHIYLCRIVGNSGDKGLLTLLSEQCPMPEVLINFGADSAELVIEKLLKAENPIGKTNAIRILEEMLKPKKEGYVAAGEIRDRIKKALIASISDSDRYVRQTAVRALGNSGDKDFIPVLTEIAKSDPYHFEKKDKATGKMITRHPVREEAEKALKKLK